MRKTKKILSLICITVLLTMTLTGCEFKKEDDKREKMNKENLSDYTEYVHSNGIKFSYPSEWLSLSSDEEQPVFGDTTTGTSVNYLSETLEKKYDIDTYMNSAINNVKSAMDIVGEIKEEKVKLNGKDASIIEYTILQSDKIEEDGSEADGSENSVAESGIKVLIKQACFIEDTTAHILTVACLDDDKSEQYETMNNIINSFSE